MKKHWISFSWIIIALIHRLFYYIHFLTLIYIIRFCKCFITFPSFHFCNYLY